MSRVGVLYPGAMGITVAAALREGGQDVCWSSEGRSERTRARADAEKIRDCGPMGALVAGAEVLIAVCPPGAARALAETVAGCGFGGIYVDANAVSPDSMRDIRRIVEAGGARFVDGGIIGPPATRAGTTRLYLAGPLAFEVAALFKGSALEAIMVGEVVGNASALKMCYAAWTKGSTALLLAVRALALAYGVEDDLMMEWEKSQSGLQKRSQDRAEATAPKAWRFVGEMHEIADTFAAAGLPDGFHRASEIIYRSLEAFKDCDPSPDSAQVFRSLPGGGKPGS